jgi:hypothetical protein
MTSVPYSTMLTSDPLRQAACIRVCHISVVCGLTTIVYGKCVTVHQHATSPQPSQTCCHAAQEASVCQVTLAPCALRQVTLARNTNQQSLAPAALVTSVSRPSHGPVISAPVHTLVTTTCACSALHSHGRSMESVTHHHSISRMRTGAMRPHRYDEHTTCMIAT